MNDNATFPIEALKQTTNEILNRLKTAEEQLQALVPIEKGEETLEEGIRQDINDKFQQEMDWAVDTYQTLDTYETLKPRPFELSELNYTRTVLKRLNLVSTNIFRLTRSEQEKATDEMQFHMMHANNMAQQEKNKP